jgi:hypothetical protein
MAQGRVGLTMLSVGVLVAVKGLHPYAISYVSILKASSCHCLLRLQCKRAFHGVLRPISSAPHIYVGEAVPNWLQVELAT